MTLYNKHPYHNEVPEGTVYTFALKWSVKLKQHTIHGLWPDMETKPPYDEAWSYKMISIFENDIIAKYTKMQGKALKSQGSIFSNLCTYWGHDWKDDKQPHEELWAHEFNKHGSRMPESWLDIFGDSHLKSDIEHDIPLYFCYGIALYDEFYSQITEYDKENQTEIHFYFDDKWNFITRNNFS